MEGTGLSGTVQDRTQTGSPATEKICGREAVTLDLADELGVRAEVRRELAAAVQRG